MTLLQLIIFVWYFFVHVQPCFLKIVLTSFVSNYISVINEPHSHPRYTEGSSLKFIT